MTFARRVHTAVPAALLVAALGVLSGCGGGSGSAASSSAKDTDADAGSADAGTPKTVDCPGKATPVALPAAFTAPLPTGTVVVAVGTRSGGRTVVTGVVPKAESDVLKDLQSSYKAAGMTLTEGETEKRDAESNFTGNGLKGRWAIRELTDCSPLATRIDVIIEKD